MGWNCFFFFKPLVLLDVVLVNLEIILSCILCVVIISCKLVFLYISMVYLNLFVYILLYLLFTMIHSCQTISQLHIRYIVIILLMFENVLLPGWIVFNR